MERNLIVATRKDRLAALREKLASADVGAPKYQAVRDLIAKALTEGIWEPGERLPTEIELAKALQLSAGTVQKTYQLLVNEGLVTRRRGAGTFVADGLKQLPDPLHCRFLADDGLSYLPIYSKVVGRLSDAPCDAARPYFGLSVVLGRLDRHIHAAEEFRVLNRFCAPADIIKPILEMPDSLLDGVNLKILLTQFIERPITSISHFVTQEEADREIAASIEIRPGRLVTKVAALARTIDDAPLYFQELYIPPTNRPLVIESIYRS